LAILINLENKVLSWSEVTRVAGGQYPFKGGTYSKSDSMVLLEGPKKETKEMRLLRQKCRKKEIRVGSE
jgi:hypothetical protein